MRGWQQLSLEGILQSIFLRHSALPVSPCVIPNRMQAMGLLSGAWEHGLYLIAADVDQQLLLWSHINGHVINGHDGGGGCTNTVDVQLTPTRRGTGVLSLASYSWR